MRKVAAVELPVPFEEFFACCWSDDAQGPFTKAVHEERGDSEVHVTNWSLNKPNGFCRDLTFRSPIRGMSLGPKSTYCHQTQQIRRYADDSFTIQTSQARAPQPPLPQPLACACAAQAGFCWAMAAGRRHWPPQPRQPASQPAPARR